MYKVLIVDDERLIREGLRTIIDWNRHGFEVADMAADGEEAIAKYERLVPDLVIADIRMPEMDGLRLIRTLQKRTGAHPHFFILSGFAEFDYAREAIELKADGYLLKPIDEDELSGHLDKLKPILDQEKLAAPSDEVWTAERVITGLLAEQGSGIPDEAADRAGLRWPGFETVLIKAQSTQEIHPSTIAGIKMKLSDHFDAAGAGAVFSSEPYLGIILKRASDQIHCYERVYKKVLSAFTDTGISFTAVSGGVVHHFREIVHSYRRALDLMRHRFLYEGDRIYQRAPDICTITNSSAKPFDPAVIEETLFLTLDYGDGTAAVSLIGEAGQAMLAADMSETDIKNSFAQMMTAVIAKLAQRHPQIRAKSHRLAAVLFEIHQEYRYLDMMKRLAVLTHEITGELQAYASDRQIKKITEMIHRNYDSHLKLESLAQVFGYSSTYLGKMFKAMTGEYFNTYLDKVRITKAKELLEQGMKIYEISERVGYCNPDYFHSKFRKYAGMSPSAFRKVHRSEGS